VYIIYGGGSNLQINIVDNVDYNLKK
jgi:hypothetical protein